MADGFTRVRETPEERAVYIKKYGRSPAVHRAECVYCNRRIWLSGLGVASHRRACKGSS